MNRFQRVNDDTPTPNDAVVVRLWRDEDGAKMGQVYPPIFASGDSIVGEVMLEPVTADRAVKLGVSAANARRIPMVVADPHGVWEAAWGELS